VFLFALSDNSLRSKPCRAELDYAKALGVPILPVLIGPVSNYRTDPIFATQLIDYRDSTRNSGIELVSALHESAARRMELPDPLPEPPAIPYEYLLRLGADIRGSAGLAAQSQAAMVFELRTALNDEDDSEVRDDIRDLLRTLRDRRDVIYPIVREIDSILTRLAGDGGIPAAPAPATQQSPSDGGESTRQPATQSRRWTRGRIVVAAAVITVVVGIVVTLAVFLSGGSSQPVSGQSPPVPGQAATGPFRQVVELPFTAGDSFNRVAVDGGGNVYVTDDTANQVMKLAVGSTTPTQLPFTGLDFPVGVSVTHNGTIYVADRRHDRVLKLDPGAAAPSELTVKGPSGLAVDSDDTVYVGAIPQDRTQASQVLAVPSGAAAGTPLPFTGLKSPVGVAVDPAGTVYVADNTTNRVLKLPPGAPTPTELPFTGVNQPWGVAVDTAGNVYVADNGGKRVLELAPGSTTPTELPFGGLKGPRGIAVGPGGSVFVVDASGRVLKLAHG
jgi:streptogramin lyase